MFFAAVVRGLANAAPMHGIRMRVGSRRAARRAARRTKEFARNGARCKSLLELAASPRKHGLEPASASALFPSSQSRRHFGL